MYIALEKNDTHNNVVLRDAPSTVFQYNEEYNTFVSTLEGTELFLGTTGTYQTISANSTDKLANGFPVHLYEEGEEEPDEPEEPEKTYVVAEKLEAGKAYKFGLQQENLEGKPILFFNGQMDGYYFATTKKADEALDVTPVETEGGYYLTFKDADGKTMYIALEKNDTHNNVVMKDAPSTVFTYNEEYKTFVSTLEDTELFLGTSKSYQTISANKLAEISGKFPAHLYEEGEEGGDNPDPGTDPDPGETGEDTTVTLTASALGLTNGTEVPAQTLGDVTLTFGSGTNNNAPKYYTTGTAIRAYGDNTLTFTCPEGKVIKNIVFTFDTSYNNNAMTANGGTYADGTWTGSLANVVFTVSGTSGHTRIQTITVTYGNE
jgi:hypothetical protein